MKQESAKLVKYFLASITTPENDLWVNLSPYEKNRIIPKSFGQTDMGRDLLGEDYILKQITASLVYPEGEIGKKFWKRVYEQAAKKFGTTDIPVNTFNKVWIVPDHAKVYEHGNTAFVVKASLKVMLEEDYLALSHTVIPGASNVIPAKAGIHNKNNINFLGSRIIREIVIPELEKEVNEGQNFATLRQVYYSLILAVWFKKRMKDSVLGRKYMDQNKISNLSSPNASVGDPDTIYQRYLKAFKKGVYNYIKEEPDPATQEMVPRKYFSGGWVGVLDNKNTQFEQAMTATEKNGLAGDYAEVAVNFDSAALVQPKAEDVKAKLESNERELEHEYVLKKDLEIPDFTKIRIISEGSSKIYINPDDPIFYKVVPYASGIHELSVLRELEGVSGVPQVLSWGRMDDGQIWMRLQGFKNTKSIMQGVTITKMWKNLTTSKRFKRLADVADILEAAHQRGISHNDLKPQNIVINDQGKVMVIDWHLAKALGDKQTDGTPMFEAPEEFKVAQSDVFSLGISMFYSLSSELGQTSRFAIALQRLYDRMTIVKLPEKRPMLTIVSQVLRELAKNAAKREAKAAKADLVRKASASLNGRGHQGIENTNNAMLIERLVAFFNGMRGNRLPPVQPANPEPVLVAPPPSVWKQHDIVKPRGTEGEVPIISTAKKIIGGQLVPMIGIGENLYTLEAAFRKFEWVRGRTKGGAAAQVSQQIANHAMNSAMVGKFVFLEGPGGERAGLNRWEYARDLHRGHILKIGEKVSLNRDHFPALKEYEIYREEMRGKEAEEFEQSYARSSEFIPIEGQDLSKPLASRREVYRDIRDGFLHYEGGKILSLFPTKDYQVDELQDYEGLRNLRRNVLPYIQTPVFQTAISPGIKLGSLSRLDSDYHKSEVPFIKTNENWEPMIWLLRHVPRVQEWQRGLHIGFSGLLNLDIMAERKSNFGILLDVNERTVGMFKLLSQLITDATVTDRRGFVDLFEARLTERSEYFMQGQEKDLFEFLEKQLKNKNSWLGDGARFNHIRNMFIERRIVFFRADIRDVGKFKEIASWVKQNSLIVDTLYVSNIYEKMEDGTQKKEFANSISQLINGQTILLETMNVSQSHVTLAYKDPRVDRAVLVSNNLGGIDLTAKSMKLEVDSDKASVSQPVDLKALENIEINGLYIKDIQIKPLKDLPQLLGVSSR